MNPQEIMDQAVEVIDVIGKMGAESVEFGFLPDDPDDEAGEATWWAKVQRGRGDILSASARSADHDSHLEAMRAALLEAWAECLRQSPHTESQVHPWRWPTRREAIDGSRKLLTDVGVTRTLVVHHGSGQGFLTHTDSSCWCKPDLVEM